MTELTFENAVAFKSSGIITLEWLKEFARVSGDYNPIHQDESVARAMGLPGVIAHGMLTASLMHSRAIEAMVDYRDLRGFRITRSEVRFRSMTFLGDEISIGGHWEAICANEIRLELLAQNQNQVTTVSANFMLAR
ncbi:MAG: MaoC family dehydratase N-terminal domain-containing protein [Cryobacterium sp.]|nr:MaoC family dehydratase N-terminal domain-containing protein [Oligoflexia bacterium]